MSGHNLRLNNTTINGPGNIFYLTTNPDEYSADQYASSCFSSLLDDVGSTNLNLAGQGSENQIWPINIDDTKRGVSGLPPANLFEKERVDDTTSSSNSSTVRIWSFDDRSSSGDRDGDGLNDLDANGEEILYPPLPCGEAICVRNADQTNASDFRTVDEENLSLNSSASTIKLSKEILCKGSEGFDCHVYIDHINLSKTKLHFETSSTRAIVLHLDQP